MKIKTTTLLLIFLILVPISCTTLSKQKSSDLENKAPKYEEIKDCPCQDQGWVASLVDDVDKFYRDMPAGQRLETGWQRRNYNAGGAERRKIKKRGGIEVMRSFSGLSPLFYAQGNSVGFDNSKLLRKERFIEKWAPNIIMFKDDFKPVSIKRIFEVATVYISSNKKVVVKLGESIPGKLLEIEDNRSKNSFNYKIVPKEFFDSKGLGLNKLRARYRLFFEGAIDKMDRSDIRRSMKKYIKEGKEEFWKYQKAVAKGEIEGLIDPTKLKPNEIQQVLSKLAPVDADNPHFIYLSINEDEIMNSKRDLSAEAHVYGVVKEFSMDDGYEYASLQYHLFYLNSFLPSKLLYWHQGDPEKVQIVLRRPIGTSDENYQFYGAEASQHYYATTYFTEIFPNKVLKGDERFRLYVSEGSHASQFLPGYHLSAKNQWGPYAEHRFLGKKLYRDTFTDPLKMKAIGYVKQGKLVERAPSDKDPKEEVITLEPISFHKLENGKLYDEELNNKYVLHSNYPDNSWIWMGFSDADRNFHLGAKSILPGGSGPPVQKYFADIPGKSLFCNPIDHYYYYFRPTEKIAKVAAKLNNAPDTVDLVISYGKLYRLLYEAFQVLEQNIFIAADEAIEYQAELAMKFVRTITRFNLSKYILRKGTRQQEIDEERKRVDDVVMKLQDFIRPDNTQTNEGLLKLLNEITKG